MRRAPGITWDAGLSTGQPSSVTLLFLLGVAPLSDPSHFLEPSFSGKPPSRSLEGIPFISPLQSSLGPSAMAGSYFDARLIKRNWGVALIHHFYPPDKRANFCLWSLTMLQPDCVHLRPGSARNGWFSTVCNYYALQTNCDGLISYSSGKHRGQAGDDGAL